MELFGYERVRFCTNVGNTVLCRRDCFVEDCERYGGNVLIQSRLNNTAGYLRRVVLWPAVKVVKLVTWRVNRSGGVVQYLSLCLNPWDIARLLTNHGGQQLSLVRCNKNEYWHCLWCGVYDELAETISFSTYLTRVRDALCIYWVEMVTVSTESQDENSPSFWIKVE
jgi:hypothetical protein